MAGLAWFSAAALLFEVLTVTVRVRWLPLESVDRGVAADLNRAVADRPAVVSALKTITLLGSNGVLGWLVATSALILLVRKRWRLAGYLLVTSAGGLVLDPTLEIADGLVMPRTRAWWRWLFIAVAVLMPLWVALSRVYRSMHHPTDILGSVVLAACWVTAMVLFVRPNRDLEARATTTAGAASGTEPTREPKVGAPA